MPKSLTTDQVKAVVSYIRTCRRIRTGCSLLRTSLAVSIRWGWQKA